ncbi:MULTISPECIES: hypothetical protein [Oscillospiraceae]|uniref:Uncharacterized protein n=1 Tax=Harryflintia acetispora TaxID=1849041 RepID=A0A9X8Y922_9FIRM|nr:MULTISPECIES: hypothetical protein [Oscillospiraceae]RGB69799.1 hypothetical protein DW086_01310 [Harryflintia acetispora]TCL44638.1 hypothetical protein EDD78_102264 [Harryflintia acetispora]
MKKSTQVAMGGICASLCLFLMFMTCMFPFTQFAFPALAGIVLIAVVFENGRPTATLVYVAVSILSLIIVPVKEAAFLFVGFFGYYPIIKSKLEQLRPRLIEYLVKFLIFNASVIGCYAILIYIMGIDEVLEETGMFGQYSLLVLILLGNIMFIIYDFAITNLTYVYTSWFRPKILRKIQ